MISIEVKVHRHQPWFGEKPHHIQSTKFKLLGLTLFERQKVMRECVCLNQEPCFMEQDI